MLGALRSRIRSGVVVAAMVMMAAQTAGWADEQPEALIRQGVEMRKRGEDATAYGYFKRAYELAHTPRAAAQLGLVEQALGNFLDANQHLTEALESHDPWVNQKRTVLEQSRETVRMKLGTIDVRGLPADARVAMPGLVPAPVPADHILWVAPGPVALTFSAPNRGTVRKETAVSAKSRVALDVELPPATPAAVPAPVPAPVPVPVPVQVQPEVPETPSPTVPPETPRTSVESGGGRGLRIAGIVAAGVGVALGITGAVIYKAGQAKYDAIVKAATAQPPSYDDANANYHERDTGAGLLVAGGVIVATGVALYIVGHNSTGTTKDTNVAVGYIPGVGGNFVIDGRF